MRKKLSLFTFITFSFFAGAQNLQSVTSQNWNGTGWNNLNLQSFAYNGSGARTIWNIQNWNSTTNTWVNNLLTTYTLNADNIATTDETQKWSLASSQYENYQRHFYTLSAANNVLVDSQQNWDGTNWVNQLKITNIYDANNFKNLVFNGILGSIFKCLV
jgi:hypothetical protein